MRASNGNSEVIARCEKNWFVELVPGSCVLPVLLRQRLNGDAIKVNIARHGLR